MELDTVIRIASTSKLITSVAAMQCVDRGQIGLDDDVSEALHELRDIKILRAYPENGEPTYEAPHEKITLR